MSTIILVDRIGEGSRITEMAKQLQGHVVQMSMSMWIREVAIILNESLKYKSKILKMKNGEIKKHIKQIIHSINLYKFI